MYGKRNYYISAEFAGTAYCYAELDGLLQLKDEAEPISWAAHVYESTSCEPKHFRTLDELIVWLHLNCVDKSQIVICNGTRFKEASQFIAAWTKHE